MTNVFISIAILMVVLIMGTSIPFAFGAGMIYLYFSLHGTFATGLPVGFNGINTAILLAIPTFVMAGGFIERGRIGDQLVSFLYMIIGKIRGGLCLVVAYASAVFGAISGSAAATNSCIGSVMAPRLKAAGYSDALSAAVIASSAPLGLLIPPSSMMIMYAWLSGESVLTCFVCTVVPGVLLATLIGIVGIVIAKHEGVQPASDYVPLISREGERGPE